MLQQLQKMSSEWCIFIVFVYYFAWFFLFLQVRLLAVCQVQ